MKHIIHPTLKIIAQWPDDKFDRFRPYLRKELTGENYSALVNMRTALKQEQQQLTTAYVNFTIAEWLGYEDNDIDDWS
jgi:hypothetical protein